MGRSARTHRVQTEDPEHITGMAAVDIVGVEDSRPYVAVDMDVAEYLVIYALARDTDRNSLAGHLVM